MARVYISTHDSIHYYVYDEQECNDTFGDEFIDDCGTDIPDELLSRYKSAYTEFWKIQDEIESIRKQK